MILDIFLVNIHVCFDLFLEKMLQEISSCSNSFVEHKSYKSSSKKENTVIKKILLKKSQQQFSELTNNLFDQDRVLNIPGSAGSSGVDGSDSN